MAESCIVENKLGDFVECVERSEKFEISGTDKDDSVIVLCDTTKQDGDYGRYIEVPVNEIIGKPIPQILDVLNNKRKDISLNGVTRIVGYYSKIRNWNSSKQSELRDRIISRYEGGYGFSGTGVNRRHIDDALVYADNSPR